MERSDLSAEHNPNLTCSLMATAKSQHSLALNGEEINEIENHTYNMCFWKLVAEAGIF